jgi:hypothetical protein
MRFLNCTFVRGIKREHTNPLLIGQAQIEHVAASHSSTLCQLAQRYSIRLNREALLSRADTIVDPVMVSAQSISEALGFLASLLHPRNWFALDLF